MKIFVLPEIFFCHSVVKNSITLPAPLPECHSIALFSHFKSEERLGGYTLCFVVPLFWQSIWIVLRFFFFTQRFQISPSLLNISASFFFPFLIFGGKGRTQIIFQCVPLHRRNFWIILRFFHGVALFLVSCTRDSEPRIRIRVIVHYHKI